MVVTGFVMFCPFSGLVGWLCQLPFLFPGVPSMSNTPKIISNLGEISRNGIPLGSLLEVFPALHSSFLFLPASFQQEACVYVWLSLVLSCFVHFLGWLGGCVSCLFLFPGVPSMSNTPKINSNLGEISRNGIPLGSLLEVFPALHSFFLFLPFSFQQEACVYVWLSLVLSCCPFSGLVGRLCQMAFHWALSWKRSQPCILPFYFFQRLFSKKHVFMFCRLLVCGTLRGKWLIYLIEVNAQIIIKFVGFEMQWYTCINVLVTLDANRYTQCADLFLRNHQEKSERIRKIPKLFDVVKGYVGVGWRLWRFIPCAKRALVPARYRHVQNQWCQQNQWWKPMISILERGIAIWVIGSVQSQ